MKRHRRTLAWLTSRETLDPVSDQRLTFGVGLSTGQRWHRGSVAPTAETLEKHRLVWAARRDDRSVSDAEIAPLRGNAKRTHRL
jgi:hypothetical protein